MMMLLRWPKCHHLNPYWRLSCYTSNGVAYNFREALCPQCGRPLMDPIGDEFPPRVIREIRQHLARWHLGKHAEHAGNVLVHRG